MCYDAIEQTTVFINRNGLGDDVILTASCILVRNPRVNGDAAPVVDPVICSTSGYSLMEDDALEGLLVELLPLARLVTPNIPEAERIIERRIDDVEGMRAAAKAIRERGAHAVLIKGGHLWDQEADGSRQTAGHAEAIDVLDNDGSVTVLRGEWIEGANLRGTGCMLSAAIAACLGKGMTLEESVSQAKTFVARAISARSVG